MNLNDLIKSERLFQPPRIILYGPHKIGKSTFASLAPSPVFLPTENGLTTIDVPAFPLSTDLDTFFSYIKMLIDEENEYKTVVIDTIDWLERLIWKKVCTEKNVENIEDIGYAKGYIFALSYWEKLLSGLEILKESGKAIIMLAHAEVKGFNPPDNQSYDRWQIKTHHKAAAKCEEWADAILFANYKTYVSKKQGESRNKATGGERVIYTSPNPAFVAGNRYDLPEEMAMDFNEVMKQIKGEK